MAAPLPDQAGKSEERGHRPSGEVFDWILVLILGSPIWLIFLVYFAYFVNILFEARAGYAFEKIGINAPETKVVSLLGNPGREKQCESNTYRETGFNRDHNDERCVREVRYEYFLGAYGVRYGADRRVLSKYHYVSE